MRSGKEFSTFTKETAWRLSGHKCVDADEECSGDIEFDHILPIYICLQYFPNLSSETIKSVANCAPRCHEHHKRRHQKNDWTEFQAQAVFLASIQGNELF